MNQKINIKYKDLFTLDKRYQILMGGRGAGRSTVESQYILAKLIAPEYFRCAIMRFVLGDIRNSCFREIKDRAEEQGILDKLDINDSQMTIACGSNVVQAHGFRKSSGDQSAKLKSLANYNHVWIEEADEVPEGDFMQLDDSLRTVKGSISLHLTLNPPQKTHWIIRRFFDLSPSEQQDFYIPHVKKNDDVHHIFTDYRDNIKNIDEGTQRRYEEYRETKPEHYWNMIKGYVPETVRGKIFNGWKVIDEIPHEARLVRRGLDFGYARDPTAICDIYEYNGGIIIDEHTHALGLLSRHIADKLLASPEPMTLVVADSASPLQIAEIKEFGVNIIGAIKGQGSVEYGIKHVESFKISLTRRSQNYIASYENFAWKINKQTGEAMKEYDHYLSDAMMSVIYGLSEYKGNERRQEIPREQKRVFNNGLYIG